MPAVDKTSAVIVLALAAFAAAGLAIRVGHTWEAARSSKVLDAARPLVRVVDSEEPTGYLNGRPVPSGFSMPVVTRWKPQAAEASPTRPVQANTLAP
jgi:hypothetical protein